MDSVERRAVHCPTCRQFLSGAAFRARRRPLALQLDRHRTSEELIRFALIFYEAGSFPQRLLARLGARDQRALSRLSRVRVWRDAAL